MRRFCFKLVVSVHLWWEFGLPGDYMKFGLIRAWSMAETIWRFRQYCRENGVRLERVA